MSLKFKNIISTIFIRYKNILENHLINYPAPASLYYAFGFGSLLGLLLIIQVATGVLLAMHYVPHIDEAFSSVERIMREIPSGWLLRYMHANGSSFLFILLYLHVARGIYFISYRKPKQWVWSSGVVLFILMAGIAFLGYTLPWGQMSFWGSTVITNFITSLPIVGQKIVIWVWGGFSINTNTLNRFFSLHYILSIIALGLSGAHLILLHFVGSTTPTINETELDLVKFSPAFVVKDAFTFLMLLVIFMFVVIYKPNMFGHPDNYIRADALVTPAHIVPEWYFLPFYAMLKAFPSKGAGILAMLFSMLIMITAPWMDAIWSIGNISVDPKFRLFFRIIFMGLVIDMLLLGWLGGLAVSDVNQIWMQYGTALYFFFWIILVPLFNYIDTDILFKFIKIWL
jgi:quinol-cytochrome oxidoreductase complex cytochrome b subunit